jgi:low temperature requirement protein LtrA
VVPQSGPRAARRRDLVRGRAGSEPVTNVELFYDLVYVFAVTQLSHYLLAHPTLAGPLQAALLLAMVWLLWVYTTWVTNWLDPDRIAVRLLLLGLTLTSLVLSAAFGARGLAVGVAYAVMQIGRSVFTVIALRGRPLQRNFQRILAWCLVSGLLAVLGGVVTGPARALLWLGAIGVDLLGGLAGFYTPRLGRSTTADWTIEGSHFAERCQGFILIALGESIVVSGATLAALQHVSQAAVVAFATAFVSSAGLWWLYFDRTAQAGAQVIASSADPGRLGRSAYHLVHPFMVAGIIVTAAADELVLSHPDAAATPRSAWMILGGPGLFIAGHAAFKAILWHRVPGSRIASLAVLGLLGLLVPHVSGLVLSIAATAVVVVLVLADFTGVNAPRDAGEPDAGEPDAGEPDAGEPDAGEPDAGESDAGEPDAGGRDAVS